MNITLDQLTETVEEILRSRGLSDADVAVVGRDLIGAELEGKHTHGLGKLFLLDELLKARQGCPVVKQSFGAVEVIDARRELGQISGKFGADRAVELASKWGIGVVSIVNSARYARLSFLGNMIAEAGQVGVIANDAGPAAVVPYGGLDPVLGTNPLCFAFPGDPALIVDFSTAVAPWGAIRQAILAKGSLPLGAFIDESGRETTDPEAAAAVRAFGSAKGYALCLALELLCGGLLTGIVGTDVNSEYDLGNLIIAFNPSAFSTVDMGAVVERLRAQILSSRGSARVPGDRAQKVRAEREASGELWVDEAVWTALVRMSKGGDGDLAVSNKTN
jgi:LDH2 family malate/lactate/ureidoglycolate dehydrogenase